MENKNLPWKLLGFALLIVLLALSYRLSEKTRDKQEVKISEISSAKLEGGDNYISITLNPKAGEVLTISGWKLYLGEKSVEFPKASALPKQGQINEEKPVTLTVPSTLILSPKRSPIGVSFRENKCVGMLAHFQTFVPPLPKQCPGCKEETVGYPDYNTCVTNHKNESDFFGNTWRMYLAADTDWTTEHKVVRLYNEQGKLLDTYAY